MNSEDNKEGRYIIAMWHRANSGKTQTLRALSHLLDEVNDEADPRQDTRDDQNPAGDFTLVLQIAGRVIAIESQGDPQSGLGERLDHLVAEHRPHLIFCATRTRGETVHIVDDTEREATAGIRYERIWTSTYQCVPDRWNDCNALKARHLIELAQMLGVLPDSTGAE